MKWKLILRSTEQKRSQILQECIWIYNRTLKMMKECWYKHVIWRAEGGKVNKAMGKCSKVICISSFESFPFRAVAHL